MARPGVREAVAVGVAALIVACTSAYGEEEVSEGDTDASRSDAGSSIADANPSPETDGSPPASSDGEAPHDAAPDAESYEEACPPCVMSTCIAAGCSGTGTYNSCSKPYDITAPMSLVAFVCPEAPTVDFPQACVPGGGTKDLRVAVFRMGTSNGSGGDWSVKVTGSNAFVAGEACGAPVITCAGGTNGPTQPRRVKAGTTALIGTTNPLAACQQLNITFSEAN